MNKNQNTTNPYPEWAKSYHGVFTEDNKFLINPDLPSVGSNLSEEEKAQLNKQIDKKIRSYNEWKDSEQVAAAIAESEALYEQEEQFGDIEVLAANAPAGSEILSAGLDIIQLLLEKNISYGNSAIEPLRLFSKANNEEQIYVRVDDKLSRLKNNQSYPGDNDIDDLIGYLLLLKVARRKSEG